MSIKGAGESGESGGLQPILDVLTLAPVGAGRFTATSLDEGGTTVFGGQLLAQAIVAAATAMPAKQVMSIHLIFMRPAAVTVLLDGAVDVLHEGRTMGSSTVCMSQMGKLCAHATVQLHVPDSDLIRHAPPMPEVDPPEALAQRRPGSWWDVRMVANVDVSDPDAIGPAELDVWTRFPGAPDEHAINHALLAYATDGFLIGTAMRPHAGIGQAHAHTTVATTVLSHTLTFHEPFAASEWLLLAHGSPYAGRGRVHGQAQVFTRDGRHVASFVQEAMLRQQVGSNEAATP